VGMRPVMILAWSRREHFDSGGLTAESFSPGVHFLFAQPDGLL
jgi:hypothetical protein